MTRKPVVWQLLGGCMALGIAVLAFFTFGFAVLIGFNYLLSRFPSSWVTGVLATVVALLVILACTWMGLRGKRAMTEGE